MKYRSAVAGDVPYIIHSWLSSATRAWEELKLQPAERFVGVSTGALVDYERRLDRSAVVEIMQRKSCRVVVTCDEEDDSTLFGFIAYEPGIVHWVTVKHLLRKQGIARALLTKASPSWETEALEATYLGRNWFAFANKWPHLRFNPYGRARSSGT